MRKIEFEDTFLLARILTKADIKETLKNAYIQSQEDNTSNEDIYIDVLFCVLNAAAKEGIEDDIYQLMANIGECKPEDIRHKSLDGIVDFVKKVCEENNVVNFIKSAMNVTK